jgi:hypothetical protein
LPYLHLKGELVHMATNLMLVFSNPAEGKEDAFNAWYEGTHIPEMLGTPGVVAARRYEVAQPEGMPVPPQKYLAVYELDGDLSTVFAAIGERGKSGAISPGVNTDRESVAMWVYSPRTDRITE